MEFRWVAFITLWTLLSGPAFNLPEPERGRAANHRSNIGSTTSTKAPNEQP